MQKEHETARTRVFATSTGERPHPDSLKPILYRLRGRRSNGWPPSKDKRAKQRNAVPGRARPKLLRTYMPTLPLGEARDAELRRAGKPSYGHVRGQRIGRVAGQ